MRWKREFKIDELQSAFSPLASQWLLERERILRDRAANILSSRDAIDRLASSFSSAITTAMHNAVGTVPARNDHTAKPNSPFHFRSSRYDRLVRRCQTAGRRWQRAKSAADSQITAMLEREYRSLCQERKAMAAQLLEASRARYFKRIEEEAKGDARRFWHEHGRLFRSNSAVSYEARRLPQAVLGPGGRRELITAPEEVLERWRATFEAVSASEPPTAPHATEFMREVSESLRLPFERLPECARSEALISLERAVSPDEVKSAIKRMRRNAASGADSIPSWFFKDGGARVVECVTHLLNDVLSCGEWPSDWLLGWIIPIYKKGVRADTGNYRGITLLPALDKLCRSVLNHRLSAAIESSHLLSDYQVGFRAHRGTMDHLITLNELITAHNEQKQPLYMGFLDVAKAYDHTWRDGLWWRLRRIGVTDRLLRVWRSSYKHVSRAVLIDDELTDTFECRAGVAQGAIDSPTLYDVFVDELASTLIRLGFGVTLGAGEPVPLLMYADDVVLLASFPDQLQRMLDAVTVFAERWQFSYNIEKSAVVVAAHRRSQAKISARSHDWRLAGKTLPVLDQYKYLGVEVGTVGAGRWRSVILRAIAATKGRGLRLLWSHGNRYGLYPALQMRLWHATCRPLLEYGCALWGTQLSKDLYKSLDRLQTKHAKSVLGLDDVLFTPNAFVNAELGLCSISSRRDELTLRVFGSIMSQDPAHSLVARVVRHRLAQARASDSQSACASQSWVQLIRPVFKRYKLDGAWITGDVGDVGKWRQTCHKAVRGELKKEWPKLAAKRSSLALYRTLKQLPYPEPYLDRSTKNREGRRLKVLLRAGVLGLMNTIGDRLRVEASSEVRQCWMCRARGMSPAPKEDALHFVVGCPALAHLREQMFECIIPALRKKSDDLFRWFSSCTPEECLSFVVGGDMHSCRAPPRPARARAPSASAAAARARSDPALARNSELYKAMRDPAVGLAVDRAFQNFLLRAWRLRDVLCGGRWALEFHPKAAEAVARVRKARCKLDPNTAILSHLPMSLVLPPLPSAPASEPPRAAVSTRSADRVGGPSEFDSDSENESDDDDDEEDDSGEQLSPSANDGGSACGGGASERTVPSASVTAAPAPASAPAPAPAPERRRLPVFEALAHSSSARAPVACASDSDGESQSKPPLLVFYAIAHINRRRVSIGVCSDSRVHKRGRSVRSRTGASRPLQRGA